MTRSPSALAYGALSGVFGGLWALLTGLLDPAFLAGSELWYPFVATVARTLGPALAPQVPWQGLMLAASAVFLAVVLYRIDKNSESGN